MLKQDFCCNIELKQEMFKNVKNSFSAVSNFPLVAQTALITQTPTTSPTSKGPPAKNETDCFTLTAQQRHQG